MNAQTLWAPQNDSLTDDGGNVGGQETSSQGRNLPRIKSNLMPADVREGLAVFLKKQKRLNELEMMLQQNYRRCLFLHQGSNETPGGPVACDLAGWRRASGRTNQRRLLSSGRAALALNRVVSAEASSTRRRDKVLTGYQGCDEERETVSVCVNSYLQLGARCENQTSNSSDNPEAITLKNKNGPSSLRRRRCKCHKWISAAHSQTLGVWKLIL